ncbi:cellobiose-specific phosphotransferase enzyme [Listeria monocytogenes]|nr:cellobiose-specific phosphotransferase enzyme [Listeria monocytogenes]
MTSAFSQFSCSSASDTAQIFASTPCSAPAAFIFSTKKLVDIPALHTNKMFFIG